MEFRIPFEVKDVECHLTWMEAMVPMLERSLVERSPTMEEHIISMKKILDEEECDGDLDIVADDTYEESYNDQCPKFCGLYASRLNEAAKLTYLSKFEEARNQLRLLETLYDHLEPCHREAFKYAVDAANWANTLLENLKKTEDEEQKPIVDPIRFQLRWDKLQEDDKSKACLKYMWACLGGNLKISEARILEIFQEVVGLDPEYHIWYGEVYRQMRGLRRNSRRHEAGQLFKPSEEEQFMCQEAYARAPNIYLNIKNLAVMLKEILWVEKQEYWDSNEETYFHCIELFYEALEIARLREQGKWKKKISMYLAEFLLFGRGSKLDQDEGKLLFDQCLADNPTDSAVLHKVGKLCTLGAYNSKQFKDWKLAEQFYVHALEAKPTNYPCLKDYLRILSSQKKYMEYIQAIDWVIGEMKRDYQVSDLKIMRGCVLWIFNPFKDPDNREKAIEDWIYVEMKLPDYAKNIYAILRKPPFYLDRDVPAYINRGQLFSTLARLKKRCYYNDKERLRAINRFVEEVKIVDKEEPRYSTFSLKVAKSRVLSSLRNF